MTATKRILLILDLDETLIHASRHELDCTADFQVFTYHVYQRPYLKEFLEVCNQAFDLAVWSSASEDYVEKIVEHIFPKEVRLQFVWARNRCTFRRAQPLDMDDYYVDSMLNYEYAKNLSKLKKYGHRLERMLIVDDTPAKVRTHYGNAIYIPEYTGQTTDEELKLLAAYLPSLQHCENVRTVEKRHWRHTLPD